MGGQLMADETREVVLKLSAKADANLAKPFQDLAAAAAKASANQDILQGRLKQIQRISQRMADMNIKLQGQLSRIKIDADISPLLRTLTRAQSQVQALQSIAHGRMSAAMLGGEKFGAGSMAVTRGLSMISSEDEDLEKFLKKMLKVQSIMEIFRGSKEMLFVAISAV